MEKPMMQCGCAANATDGKGNPSCAIHIGLHPGADKVMEQSPDLTGRTARCTYCKNTQLSSTELAFFEYRPTQKFDGFYDGCRGWD